MQRKRPKTQRPKTKRPKTMSLLVRPRTNYLGRKVPLAAIRRYARQVAERFDPEQIILFGSYAYGTPHADSDVDLLVVMPARNQHSQAVKIRWEVPAPFPLDLLVRTPANLRWRLAEGESFHSEITSKGKVLYAKESPRVAAKGRRRSSGRHSTNGKRQVPA